MSGERDISILRSGITEHVLGISSHGKEGFSGGGYKSKGRYDRHMCEYTILKG
jgi:hypothetical protein